MFPPSIPQPVPIVKYTVSLTNHSVGWEFYGVRLTELSHLVWCLARRFNELEAIYEEQEETLNPIEPCLEMKLMDLANLAINYIKRAADNGIRLPHVDRPGAEIALQVGPGVFISCQCIYGVEIPTCNSPESGYN